MYFVIFRNGKRENVCEITFIHTRKKEGEKYTCKKEINFIILPLIMEDYDGNLKKKLIILFSEFTTTKTLAFISFFQLPIEL